MNVEHSRIPGGASVAGQGPGWLAAAALLPLALLAGGARATAEPPTNVDVVRRVLAAPSPDEVVRWIDEAPTCRFELGDDMIAELRAAGVPGPVVEAMRRCDARGRPPTPAPAPAPTPELRGTLTFRFPRDGKNADDDATAWKRSYAVVAELPETIRASRPDFEAPAGLALFAACVRPEHVPDHWRGRTAVSGRTARRHRLLAFHDETVRIDRRPVPLLILTTPGEVSAAVPAAEHDLEMGVAVKTGGVYEVLERLDLGTVTFPEDRPVVFTVRLRTRLAAGSPRPTLTIHPDT